jgi:hypothetical protein
VRHGALVAPKPPEPYVPHCVSWRQCSVAVGPGSSDSTLHKAENGFSSFELEKSIPNEAPLVALHRGTAHNFFFCTPTYPLRTYARVLILLG